MHRLSIALVTLGVVMVLSVSSGFCAGNVLFQLGGRTLDEDTEPLDEQGVFGVNLLYTKEVWPVSLSFALIGSLDEQRFANPLGLQLGTFDVDLGVGEFSVGVTKIWDSYTHARPYLGGGLSFVRAQIRVTEVVTLLSRDFDDGTVAPFAEGGIFWRLGKRFNIGLGARLLFGADVEFDGSRVDINYSQFHGLIGWGW